MLRRTCALVSIAFALSLFSATGAATTAKRTFVATSGSDANPCSLALPCRSFGAAITQTAAGGEVIVLDSAGYGPVTITQSVSIIAPTGVYAGVSVLSGDGITIDDGGSNTIVVVLRGLTVNGQGGTNALRVVHAQTVHVEACILSNMTQNGIYQSSGTLYVKDTIARNNGNVGAYVLGAGVVANLDRVRMEANLNGVYVQDGAQAFIQDSVLSGNGFYGVVSFTSTSALPTSNTGVSVMRTLITNNPVGAAAESDLASTLARLDVADSDLSGNSWGIYGINQNSGPTQIVATRNTIARNAWGVQLTSNGAVPLQIQVTLDGNTITQNSVNGVLAPLNTVVNTRANNTVQHNSSSISSSVPASTL